MLCRYGHKRGQGGHGLDQGRETDQFGGEDARLGCAFADRTDKPMRTAEPVVVPSQDRFLRRLLSWVIIPQASHIGDYFNSICAKPSLDSY
jgi:hypothetical protein